MTSDLIAFVRARLDQREATATTVKASLYDTSAHLTFDMYDRTDPDAVVIRKLRILRPRLGARRRRYTKRALIDEALRYTAKLDSEWGCCHDADQIAAGQCPEYPPGDITALRLLAQPDAAHPDYRSEWAP